MLEIEGKPVVLNPVEEKKRQREKSKQEELELYNKNREYLIDREVKRLKKKRGYSVVTEFDCGKGAKRRRKDSE